MQKLKYKIKKKKKIQFQQQIIQNKAQLILSEHKRNNINIKSVKKKIQSEKKLQQRKVEKLPKIKCNELMSALLQITMETEETTERVKAPTVPS